MACCNFVQQVQSMKKALLFLLFHGSLISVTHAQKKNGTKESSTVLTNWMDLHCRMVRSTSGIAHVAYSRHFSYTAIVAYESIVGSNPGYRSLLGQLNGLNNLPSLSKGDLYWPVSLNAAYAAMLRQFYSSFRSCAARIDSMEQAQTKQFASEGINLQRIEKNIAYGQGVAAAIIQWLQTDGSANAKSYLPQKGQGLWAPTPPSFKEAAVPYWSENRSCTKDLKSLSILKQPIYSPDSTGAFYPMAKEVYLVSSNLTPEQKATALFWDDSPNGSYMTVYGHWSFILSGLIKKHNLPLIEAAEAFAKMTMAMHEASILAWKGKYQYNVVRPITYIQQHIDKEWTPLISTPPHPEFPAAHATLSYAAATALCSLFGESCAVTDNTYTDIGLKERTYGSLQDVAKEAGLSRLYGGIHYRYSIEQGYLLGEAAANHVLKKIHFQYTPRERQKTAP